jgi:hypothetical protein
MTRIFQTQMTQLLLGQKNGTFCQTKKLKMCIVCMDYFFFSQKGSTLSGVQTLMNLGNSLRICNEFCKDFASMVLFAMGFVMILLQWC